MNYRMKLILCGLLVFGLSGNAAAADNNCGSFSNTFSSSIGATTSCANNNMAGCTVGDGETSCTYQATGPDDCGFTVSVPGGLGESADESTTYTLTDVTGTCQPRIAITQGNTGASYCSYFYPGGLDSSEGDTLNTSSKNGRPVAHKQLEVCTDGNVLAPTLSPPVISLEKKVVRADIKDVLGNTLPPNCFNLTDGGFTDEASDDINAIAPTEVAYCYRIENTGLGDADQILLSDELIDIQDWDLGPLTNQAPPIEVVSEIVVLSTTCVSEPDPCIEVSSNNQVLNTATVSATFAGGDCLGNCTDSDTATVNVAVQCDASTQAEADATGTVVERRGRQGLTRCAPKVFSVDQGVGLLCDGSCTPRPECAGTSPPLHCSDADVLQCKSSGNWSHTDATGIYIKGVLPSPGKLPLCQEVLRNPENTGDVIDRKNPLITFGDGRSIIVRRNPYLYYFPGSGGGNSIGTIYCILYPGETASSVCPSGSIVY